MTDRGPGPADATQGDLCVVAGVGPNLGAAVARRFAAGGYGVVLMGRNAARLHELTDELRAAGHDAWPVVADVTDDEALLEAAATCAELGSTRVLVYNAASIRQRSINDMTVDELDAEMQIIAMGAVRAVQAFLPNLQKAAPSTILFSGGGAAIEYRPDYLALTMGKAALRAFAFALAEEVAPAGIRVAQATIARGIRPDSLPAEELAERYWELHRQDPVAWQVEHVYH